MQHFQTAQEGFKAVKNPAGPVYLYETDESALVASQERQALPWVAKLEPKTGKEGFKASFRDFDEALAFLNDFLRGGL